ncbi:MAG: 3,4-dihydroxy 2-butanone 4-phosphate synthase/GTP cyclohydrolase II [bacterium]|jgi:3,4-dihydroxy 2-butanone 4-phosphate synthase/GTP cyclohydrolase II
MEETKFDTIEDALEDIRQGKQIILVDDEDRENEGDLYCAADQVTPEIINFMATHGRGLICLTLDEEGVDKLGLTMMTKRNTSVFGTNFTVSIDAAENVTTGISAYDRAYTILASIKEDAGPHTISIPGHIFPLRAQKGGVLCRAGQTEGSVDMSRLAGCHPSGVICEIMNEDGTMSRYDDLRKFADLHKLKMVTIADLIDYRLHRESQVELVDSANLPTDFGEFKITGFRNKINDENYVALVKGEWATDEPVLVRVHSQCLTGDVFSSMRCDCQSQLHKSMKMIEEEGKGVVLYLAQEGRGIGILNKIKAYRYQDEGADTVEANEKLGLNADLRTYGFGAQVLHMLGLKKLRLITNNPRKLAGLHGYGLEVVERVPIIIESNDNNRHYLKTKQTKLGHFLDIGEHP